MWDERDLLAAAIKGLRRREAKDTAADAVRGLDALDELALHPILAAGFRAWGLGVFREHPFPGPKGKRAKKSARERCDIALSPAPSLPIRDPMREDIEEDQRLGTLFAPVGPPPPPGITPEDAYWIEVKAVGQYVYVDGVPRPNSAYASELVRGVMNDLAKLAREPRVVQGAVMLMLFTADRETAEHDLAIALHRALDRGSSMRTPVLDGFPILDRIGNAWCCAALIPGVSAPPAE